ncbi:MAG: hypothetical protein RR162_03375 [Oscillospiraceae bacterium]
MLLIEYEHAAKAAAETSKQIYDETDDTYYFVKTLFGWKHPERSTFQNEGCCIVLIRKLPEQKQEIKQIWLRTYLAYETETGYNYRENFHYITSVIKNLAALQEQGQFNVFLAYCTFAKHETYKRNKDSANRAQAIAIDLDFNKMPSFSGLSYEASIRKIQNDYAEIFSKFSPMIVHSGGGCQLYFLLSVPLKLSYTHYGEDVDNAHDREIFKTISRGLNYAMLDAGADTHCSGDFARIFRVPGVYSLKYGEPRPVSITKRGNPVSSKGLYSYSEAYIPVEPAAPVKEPKVKKPPKTKPAYIYEAAEVGERGYEYLVAMRLRDIEAALSQNNDTVGFRNQIIFVAAAILTTTICDEDTILTYLNRLNNLFLDPLPAEELNATISSVTHCKYKVTNEYINRSVYLPLGTDLSKLEGRYTAEERRAAKARYNASRPHKKKFSREAKRAYIASHSNLSNRELSKYLGCTVKTVARLRSD